MERGDDRDAPQRFGIVQDSHQDTAGPAFAGRFRNRDWANRIAMMLLDIEQDPVLSITIENIVATIAEQARIRKKDLKPKLRVLK